MTSGVYKEDVAVFLAGLGAEGFIDNGLLAETIAFRVRAALRDRAALAASGADQGAAPGGRRPRGASLASTGDEMAPGQHGTDPA